MRPPCIFNIAAPRRVCYAVAGNSSLSIQKKGCAMRNLLIKDSRSLIVAADVATLEECEELAASVANIPGIGGFKIGFELGLGFGLPRVIDAIYDGYRADTKIIYDHQKAGNDIPDMGTKFARVVKESGCDSAILFPFAGPVTEDRWIKACQDAGLHVMVGSVMTHEKFLASEGGSISDTAAFGIMELACACGVRDFVVPGTKPEWVRNLRRAIEKGTSDFDLYAPGFVTQGGDLTECGKLAGKRFHAIVGSGIYGLPTAAARRAAAETIATKLAA